jgi:murein DD-endopeptidase MepM/ murein hydrolase activator NlpD
VEFSTRGIGLVVARAGRALVTAVGAAMLLTGPLVAPHEARPAGFAVPDPPEPGTAAPEAGRSPATRDEPPATREPPSGAVPGPSRGQGVLQVPPPPEGAGVPAPGARYAWPLLPAPAIATRFRAPPHPYGRGHRGVDRVGAAGQPVLAARAGTVVFAGPVGARSVVSVAHDDDLRTTYEPVRSVVRPGAVVAAGDVLGLLEPGHPGCAVAACLHWGVRRGLLEYLDPLVLLRPPEVRLLPVPDPWPAGIGTAGVVTAEVGTARAPPASRGT